MEVGLPTETSRYSSASAEQAPDAVPDRVLHLRTLFLGQFLSPGVTHVERVDHTGPQRVDLRNMDIEIQVREGGGQSEQQAQGVRRPDLDHRGMWGGVL